ncbi:uncharacterized protein LOC113339479 [Papaver somniferum]|uniref:uncharacterized protein LOC113339479 n=1 Tax=Papaver somniferum TaxID=3469 RepID=UPI000E702DFD|nr:uncharacterized protein LOC113339479 [Papaver somniferum]
MKKLFLEKYFPASKAAATRKEISGILQITGESLYEYWERYKRLLTSLPHHNVSSTLIIQYFYEGLLPEPRNLIDAAAGGSLTEKTISQTTSLIESMASNAQQFYTRHDSNVRRVSEMGESPNTEHRLSTIEKAIHRLASVVAPPYEEEAEVNALFPNPIPRYDPYYNTYNSGWKDHPNFSYANKQVAAPNPYARQGGFQQQFQSQPQPQAPKEDASEKMITMMQGLSSMFQQSQQKAEQNQLKTDNAIRDLQTQMGKLATDVNLLKSQASTKLPSQPFMNPREYLNAVTLRSGK